MHIQYIYSRGTHFIQKVQHTVEANVLWAGRILMGMMPVSSFVFRDIIRQCSCDIPELLRMQFNNCLGIHNIAWALRKLHQVTLGYLQVIINGCACQTKIFCKPKETAREIYQNWSTRNPVQLCTNLPLLTKLN